MARRPTRIVTALVATAALAGALALGAAGCSGADDPTPARGATTLRVDGRPVHAIVREPAGADADATSTGDPTGSDATTVLFLHGKAYSSRIWDERGILDAVATSGRRAVAVDLPGYGDTPAVVRDGTELDADSFVGAADWLQALVEELGGPERVVVVSPSMSGAYSLPYLATHVDEPLAGFVPVAPAGTDTFARPQDAAPVPGLVTYGSEDPIYTENRAQRLLEQLRSDETTIEVIDGAGHAAYDDDPKAFTALLLDFLDRIEG